MRRLSLMMSSPNRNKSVRSSLILLEPVTAAVIATELSGRSSQLELCAVGAWGPARKESLVVMKRCAAISEMDDKGECGIGRTGLRVSGMMASGSARYGLNTSAHRGSARESGVEGVELCISGCWRERSFEREEGSRRGDLRFSD